MQFGVLNVMMDPMYSSLTRQPSKSGDLPEFFSRSKGK